MFGDVNFKFLIFVTIFYRTKKLWNYATCAPEVSKNMPTFHIIICWL
jgi:hypothetical protein